MSLPTPVGRQKEVVCLPARGHQVVLGTAGSGKTTMAILRAAYLGHPALPGSGKVLLLTYNKALSGYIRSISSSHLNNVTVEHYHLFARGYLKANGLMKFGAIADSGRRRELISRSVESVRATLPPHTFFDRSIGFFDSEVGWLAKNGIDDIQAYLDVKRIGRGESLAPNLRRIVWDVRSNYLQMRDQAGYRYDWDDIATTVYSTLKQDVTARRYKHIVIDEGQDLSPEMLRSLAQAIPDEGSITFFGDVAQQIYGHRTSWRSAGLKPPKVWDFSENYRNSKEIAELGLAIANMPYYQGIPDMVPPKKPSAAGPRPTIVSFREEEAEIAFAVSQAKKISATASVAILVRTLAQKRLLRPLLPDDAIDLKEDTTKWVAGPNIYLGTYHSAKGLEFDHVFLPFMDEDHFPDPSQVEDFGQDEADANDGRLLYVGVTRAKTGLVLTHGGTLTHLLPADQALYAIVKK